MTGFTLGGITSEELGLILREGNYDPALPNVSETSVTIQGRNGDIFQSSRFEPRILSIPCTFYKATSLEELDSYIRALNYLLTDIHGKPRLLPLVFDSTPNRKYYVRLVSNLPVNRIVFDGEITLNLKASDPSSYGDWETVEEDITESTSNIALSADGNVASPLITIFENTGVSSVNGFTISLFVENK